MLSISQLKLRGFKSFKYANLEFPENFMCLAGPNGSGKSNIIDSLRFVMGEKSLRSLRARKVKDLIFAGANAAEVQILFEDKEKKKYEIRRAIRKDGKISYKLNGKSTTRNAVMEVLKQYNLDESGRNVIAQGRIQRIVEMTGKERRGIIESVAGISDYDKKKKEALRELDQVSVKIREGSIVLGERSARLNELKKEKEVAIQYKENKNILKTMKASLIKMELDRLDKEFTSISEDKGKLSRLIEEKIKDLEEINSKIYELDDKRTGYSNKLKEKQAALDGIKKIEQLKASIELKSNLLEDRKQTLEKMENEKKDLEKQMGLDDIEVKKILKQVEELRKELKKISPKDAEFKKDSSLKSLESSLESEQNRLFEMKNLLSSLDSEINNAKEIISLKMKQLEENSGELKFHKADESGTDESALSQQSSDLAKEISDLFNEEKKINYELANLDKELLKVRENAAQLRAQSSPQALNPALSIIKDLMETKKIQGIQGTLAELISFDPKYTSAVEASLGGRLLYVVVNSEKTATDIIQLLKKMKRGRATFIPMDRIQTKDLNRNKNLLLNYVKYNQKFSPAMEYAFSDTILADSIEEARKQKGERTVTLDGELFEKSGIITGGRMGGSLLAASQIKKLDEESEELKNKRNNYINKLDEIREDGNRKRREKAEAEVKLKSIEIEKRSFKENEDRIIRLKIQKNELNKEIKNLETKISDSIKKKSELEISIKSLSEKVTSLKQKLGEEGKKSEEKYEEMSKKRSDVASKLSSLEATIDGKEKELEIRKTELRKKELESKELTAELASVLGEMNKIKRELPALRKELDENETKLRDSGKKMEDLLNQLDEVEQEIKKYGEERGKVKMKMESMEREKHQNEVREATVKTRLIDYKAEYEEYKEIETVQLEKEELNLKIKEAEQVLNSIEAVNLAAIELYETKKKESEEMDEKVTLLKDERKAILKMMGEIDRKKKEIFFETFNAVNENFEKMLSAVPVGEGHLTLDNPEDPFESNLQIKIRKHKRDISIDSLSGGESSLVALAFIFAIQFYKPSPFYVLDEADAALDKENSKHFVGLIKQISKDTQFLAVSHNDTVIEQANAVLGVTRVDGISKIVGVKFDDMKAS